MAKKGFGGTMKIQNWEGRRVGVPKIIFQLFIKLGRRHAVPPNKILPASLSAVSYTHLVAAGIGVDLLRCFPAFPVREEQAFGQKAGRRVTERETLRNLILQHSQGDETAPTVFAGAHQVGDEFAVHRFGREVERLHGLQIVVDGEEIVLRV